MVRPMLIGKGKGELLSAYRALCAHDVAVKAEKLIRSRLIKTIYATERPKQLDFGTKIFTMNTVVDAVRRAEEYNWRVNAPC